MPARAAWRLASVLLLISAAGAQEPPAPPPPAPTATRAAALPLPEIATRSDELAVYLKQLDERVTPDQRLLGIGEELEALDARIRTYRLRTENSIAASPGLTEVDELMVQWQELQRQLNDWGSALTNSATVLEQEMRGLDELRALWRATRDEAQAAGAPAAVLERVKATLALIQQVRGRIETYRERLLVLQDRVVKEAARCREAIDLLVDYRRTAVGRLLVRDGEPIWSPARWSQSWDEMIAPAKTQLAGPGFPMLLDYARLQLPRLPLQIALFAVLLALWRRARTRTISWLAEDQTLAPVAAVFEHPVSSALFLTLLATPWIYPQVPLIARQAVRIAATLPLMRVLDRLVDRPILPGLFALGVFFVADQIRSVLTSVALLEQVLFLIEILAAVVVLAWLVGSGRIQRLRADLSPRVVAFLDRAARLLIVLLAFALLVGALGFMHLARFVAGAVFNSGYAAMLLYAMLRFAQGVWAFLLRTPTARGLRVVQHYRSLLEQRGARALSWIAAGLWIVAVLAVTELLAPVRELLRAVLTATLSVGSFSISLGDVLAFALSIWLSFLLSRFIRFVLAEDVYPRLDVARGLPYAFSTVLHYVILLLGLLVGLSAAGMQLDRFALLAGAFGVGIGFGLQNVVNNFVSGLILLFERPLQVGDTIDIGSISGEISRIGIRASVVRTGQGAEVIVPNARLISDPVVNWTLSDRMRRIEIGVTVPHGTDPDTVIATLRSVATTNPLVVESPAPTAVLVGIGDATLNFELRAWTDRFDRWVSIRSELGVAVIKAFAEAGITMRLAPSAPTPAPVAKEPSTHGEETPS